MTRTLSISDTGLRLIKAFEGYRPVDRELVTGVRVVGYGHRLESDDTVRMSRNEAEERLLDDLEPIEEMVNDEVHAPLSQGQYDALCSLAFNIGPDAFRQSDIVRAMNNGRVLDAANGFDVWRKATINGKTYVVDALMRRRTAEKSLFLRNEPAVPAPSAMLAPQPDRFAPLGPTDDGMPEFTETEAIGIVPDVAIDAEEAAVLDDIQDDSAGDLTPTDFLNPATLTEDNLGVFGLADTDEPSVSDDDDIDDEGFYEDLDDDDLDDDYDDFDGADDAEDLDGDEIEVFGDDEADDLQDENEDATEDDASEDDDAVTADDDDVYQLLDGDAVELPDTDTDTDTDDADTDAPVSVIAAAADSLGDRLSALLDSDEEAERETTADWPTSLLQSEENGQTQTTLTVSDGEPTDPVNADPSQRSNLLSFPKRELVMDAPIVKSTGVEATSETTAEAVAEDPNDKVLVIDNLAADDVMRSSRDPENPVFDPDGDPVENAMRYLERQADERDAAKTGGGLWVPLALGGLLVGASAVMIGRGTTQMLNAWGPTAATASAITGAVLVLFTVYAAARGRFA